ncbi:MAG: hypothetical protein GWN76_12905 [candidate division Zixibacteria bacterium]|nr:hypothetical protein [candidate division Zixibacteria bacterium]NIS46745.1 hypothetical protein [candidate division Zixibacteria bacterium]NIU14874.1 hypothetical protein [candidate division Zixibacteria bacterium]
MRKWHYKLVWLLPALFIIGCSAEKGTEPERMKRISLLIEAKYDYIRSIQGGGGVFIIRLVPGTDLKGPVYLGLQADDCLQAHLDKTELYLDSDVAEITINPDSTSEIRIYLLEVRASNHGVSQSIFLQVEIMQWFPCIPESALQYLPGFTEWLMKNHSEYSDLSAQDWYCYNTYPQIWIVSHWTLLSPEYEVRICHHVTIHPYNWTQYRLRKRGEYEARLAAKRDNDSTVLHEIPVSEYPILFDY